MTHPLATICAGLVLGSLFLVSEASADYAPPPLYDMVAASDLVAVGTIEALTPKSYTFAIEKRLHGEPVQGRITVQRFRDWECATRWAPYKVGQRFVLFADRTDRSYAKQAHAPATDFVVRSAGGEGEMPLVGGDVVIRGYPAMGLGTPAVHAIPQKVRGHRMALKRWVEVIASVRALYRVERGFSGKRVWREIRSIKRVGSDADFKARTQDPVVAKMAERLEARSQWIR